MVNAPDDHSSEAPEISVDLGDLKGNPAAEQAAANFITFMRERRFSAVLGTNNTVDTTATARRFSGYGHYDHSPSGAIERQDQMSHGGNGKGGNWITD